MEYNCKNKTTQNNIKLENEELISLISIYLSEWEHRDDVLWRQVFKFYYVTLIVMVFPHVSNYIGINLPIKNANLFYWIGLIMSFIFLYIALATAKRTQASYKAYEKAANLLDDNMHTYTRISVSSLPFGEFFKYSLATGIIITMFLSLVAIAFILLLTTNEHIGNIDVNKLLSAVSTVLILIGTILSLCSILGTQARKVGTADYHDHQQDYFKKDKIKVIIGIILISIGSLLQIIGLFL